MPKPPQAPQQVPATNQLKDQYAPLVWNDFFDEKEMIGGVVPLYRAGNTGHLFICLHGAGHSAMSFAALAERMKKDNTFYAFDFRGHGAHFCENETDLS
jgi:protein phosphatase methylesterase 1